LKWAPNTKLVTSFLYFLIYIHWLAHSTHIAKHV
jgi:hypothetical protein